MWTLHTTTAFGRTGDQSIKVTPDPPRRRASVELRRVRAWPCAPCSCRVRRHLVSRRASHLRGSFFRTWGAQTRPNRPGPAVGRSGEVSDARREPSRVRGGPAGRREGGVGVRVLTGMVARKQPCRKGGMAGSSGLISARPRRPERK